jgi:hypothetical protein
MKKTYFYLFCCEIFEKNLAYLDISTMSGFRAF